VSRSVLGMPTFSELCNAFHQIEEQPDSERSLRAVPFILHYLKWKFIGEEEGNCKERGKGGGNRSVFNNRKNGLPYFIYVVFRFLGCFCMM